MHKKILILKIINKLKYKYNIRWSKIRPLNNISRFIKK